MCQHFGVKSKLKDSYDFFEGVWDMCEVRNYLEAALHCELDLIEGLGCLLGKEDELGPKKHESNLLVCLIMSDFLQEATRARLRIISCLDPRIKRH